ncbi:hypothetical protein [Collimonas sp. OK242]|jgi:hypothetical protein|uniref:hypothetical protein n=1 Tax=Collimonas sp. OK242 TaxID=1798195 RepID=UPI000B839926|nr:hypothetical protein [Collimonas sp. OK242]
MKKFVLAMTLSAIVATPAMAMQENAAQFDDAQLIFKKDKLPLELALLSPQEMRDTEGAVIPVAVAIASGAAAGIAYWRGANTPNVGGLAVAVGTGVVGGVVGGVIGIGIGAAGGLYASEIRPSGKPNLACTGTPCILPK